MEQKQILSPIGVNHPLSDKSLKLLKDMKSIFQKCEKRNTNGMDFQPFYHYIDLYMENEQARSFLMDQLYDFIIKQGEFWFDDK